MKGWELLKEIAEGNIKEGARIKVLGEIYYYDGRQFLSEIDNQYLNETLCDKEYAMTEFEIIEDQEEINIQDIEEIYSDLENQTIEIYGIGFNSRLLDIKLTDKINEIVQAIKQLDKKIKENSNE